MNLRPAAYIWTDRELHDSEDETMEKIIVKIQAVQNTLEQVSVTGAENWNKMLGCFQTLQEVKKELIEDASKHESECATGETETAGVCGS